VAHTLCSVTNVSSDAHGAAVVSIRQVFPIKLFPCGGVAAAATVSNAAKFDSAATVDAVAGPPMKSARLIVKPDAAESTAVAP